MARGSLRTRGPRTSRAPFVAAALGVVAAAAVVFGSAACGGAAEDAPGGDPQTRARMHEIFGSMRVLLPAAADPRLLADPADRAGVAGALDVLARNAFALSQHAGGEDPGYRQLGSSLARDARDAKRFLAEGRPDASAFLILQTTDHCVACHSKLPSPGDSPLAEQFVESSTLEALPLEQRASLEVATRRFEDALASYERLLAAPDRHPAQLLGALTDYLVVSIRVKGDFQRPRPTLERFSARPDLWTNLRGDVQSWIASLPELAAVYVQEPSVDAARALLREAQSRLRFPEDRRALVHYVTASSMLQRVVAARRGQANPDPAVREELAEAYYLLGLAESHLESDAWVSETPSYLEAAIRLAPQGPYAGRAYALLEQEIVLGYTGSGGAHVPDEVADRLRELRDLVDAL